MSKSIIERFLKNNIDKSNIIKLDQDASKRLFYKIKDQKNNSYILMDSSKEPKQFKNLLKVNNLIKDINISIPEIIDYDSDKFLILFEDFGEKRFDKLINNSKYTKVLLKTAIESLIVIKKSYNIEKNVLPTYNFYYLEKEISEFIDWYYPFIWKKKISNKYKKEFFKIWKELYNNINFDTKDLVHRDFFCNNLLYLPSRKKHLRCGIIDYQDAFLGDQTLDIISLFEDSRRIIDQSNKQDLIKYYLTETNQTKDKKIFFDKINFLGACRQTRILGRWVKLYNKKNNKNYLNYINYTWYWLEKNLNYYLLDELNYLYKELIPKNKRKYEN